ncbi:TPA: hypothetical protein ACIVDT_003547 [Salmonella enterica subsp. enterica serovar Eastbourne]
MKKTLIALAVAASAAVSGSAMAWTANGSGGSVDLGGSLTPVEKVTPWEVKVGAVVNDLNGAVQKGQKEVSVVVNKAIPVLGIRNANANGFKGGIGIKPQIDYNNAVDLSSFKNGTTTLTLPVKNNSDNIIGSMTVPFSAGAVSSWGSPTNAGGTKNLYATNSDASFYGGLGYNRESIRAEGNGALINSLSPEYMEKWKVQGTWEGPGEETFVGGETTNFFGVYGSGIEQGKTIQITLEQAASGDAPIQWKASLPVIVSYM